MKITIDIQENRFNTFLAFLKTLDYVSVTKEEDILPWQIEEVNKRLKELEKHPEKAIDFDKIVSSLENKYGL